jgi:hypothetical protein
MKMHLKCIMEKQISPIFTNFLKKYKIILQTKKSNTVGIGILECSNEFEQKFKVQV